MRKQTAETKKLNRALVTLERLGGKLTRTETRLVSTALKEAAKQAFRAAEDRERATFADGIADVSGRLALHRAERARKLILDTVTAAAERAKKAKA